MNKGLGWGAIAIGVLIFGFLGYFTFFRIPQGKVVEPCTIQGTQVFNDRAYAKREKYPMQSTSLDLYVPRLTGDCAPVPVVVWIHGGGFTSGDKSLDIEFKSKLFADQGWAFASVNYRLNSKHPDYLTDVAAALSWLQGHSKEYNISTQNIMLVGFSAGAFISSLISVDPAYLQDAGVAADSITCTVSLDTGAYDVPRFMASDDGAVPLYAEVLGLNPADWEANSPVHRIQVADSLPDFILVTRGIGIRPELTDSFASELKKENVKVKVFNADPYDHGQLDTMLGAPGDNILTPVVTDFLKSCNRV